MKSLLFVASFAVACAAGLSAANAFEIVSDNSGFIAPGSLLSDPDDQSDGSPSINEFTSSAGLTTYHVPADAFDEGFSYSGYAFEDEVLAKHPADDQAKTQTVTVKPVEAVKKPVAKH